mgnify:CR=1 FL=1
MEEIRRFNKDQVIKQSNRLVDGRYRLTPAEQKLIIAIVSQIDKNGCFETIKLRVSDLIDFCGFEKKKGYSLVRLTIQNLMNRKLEIKYPNGDWRITHWIQSVYYHCKDGVLEYRLDDDLKPDLLNLQKAYLSTPAALLLRFQRDYTPRLYTVLKKMAKVAEFEYSLEFFYDRFVLPDSYKKNFTHFRKKFLDPCVTEINEKSDINVKFELIKDGRSYKKIKFIVEEKSGQIKRDTATIPESFTTEGTRDSEDGLSKEENEIFAKITNPDKWNVSSDSAINLIETFGVERVKKNLLYCDKNRKGKRNLAGFLIKMIREDAAGDEERRVAKKKNEEVKQKERNRGLLLDEPQNKENKAAVNDLVYKEKLSQLKKKLLSKSRSEDGRSGE